MNEINQFFSKLCLVSNRSNPPKLPCSPSKHHLNKQLSLSLPKSKVQLERNNKLMFLVNRFPPLETLEDNHLYLEISSRLNKHNKFSPKSLDSSLSQDCLVASKHNSNNQADYSVNNRHLWCKAESRLEVCLVKSRVVDCLDSNHKTSNKQVILVKEASSFQELLFVVFRFLNNSKIFSYNSRS